MGTVQWKIESVANKAWYEQRKGGLRCFIQGYRYVKRERLIDSYSNVLSGGQTFCNTSQFNFIMFEEYIILYIFHLTCLCFYVLLVNNI